MMNTGRATFQFPRTATRKQLLPRKSLFSQTWCRPDLNPAPGHRTPFSDGITEAETRWYAGCLGTTLLYSGLGCLNAQGINVSEHKEPKFINTQRAKKGKVPVFGYRWVTVDPGLLRMPGVRGYGTHASPRLHWRRAHKRTLADGREVLVRACLVGDPERGFVQHDYRVGVASERELRLS
jgi:hypothetical protein